MKKTSLIFVTTSIFAFSFFSVIFSIIEGYFIKFTEGFPSGATNTNINVTFCDSENNIWVGDVNQGLYEKKSESLSFNIVKDGIPTNMQISAIIQDNNGAIWVSGNEGLYKKGANKDQFVKIYENLPLNQNVANIYSDSVGNIWVLYNSDDGLYWQKPGQTTFSNFEIQEAGSKNKIKSAYAFTQDHSGNFWIIVSGENKNEKYLYTKTKKESDFKKKVIKNNSSSEESEETTISGVYYDDQNNIWAGSTNGLYEKTSANNDFQKVADYSMNGTHQFYQDKEKNIWIGTDNEGLYLKEKNSSVFSSFTIDASTERNIQSITQDNDGYLWLGIDTGLYQSNFKLLPSNAKKLFSTVEIIGIVIGSLAAVCILIGLIYFLIKNTKIKITKK